MPQRADEAQGSPTKRASQVLTPLAVAAAMATSSEAYAMIIHSGLLNTAVDGGSGNVPFDFDTDLADEFEIYFDGNYGELRLTNFATNARVIGASYYLSTFSTTAVFADNLNTSQQVSVAGPFTSVSTGSNIYLNWSWTSAPSASSFSFDPFGWVDANPGYLGFEFDISGMTHYGWIQITRNGADQSGTIVDWAYESTADTAIQVGAVPEPGTLSMLAMGATALTAYRRRQKKAISKK